MLKLFWDKFKEVLLFAKSLLSEADGTASSTRFLMVVFSLFSIHTLHKIVTRMLTLNDPVLIVIFFNGITTYAAAMVTLILAPYGVNKGAGAVHRIVDLFGKKETKDALTKIEDVAHSILPKPKEKR
jgi:hypothetical protein